MDPAASSLPSDGHFTLLAPVATDGGLPRLPIGLPVVLSSDRLLSPRTVSRATVRVNTGALGVFGGVRYDPARRLVMFFPNPGDLRVGLAYTFTVRPGVETWDGAPVVGGDPVRFIPTPRLAVPTTRPPSLARDIAPLLSSRCAREGCHGGETPAMALDLSTPHAILNTTVGVLARERPALRGGGAQSTDPEWGAMVRVDRGVADGQGRPETSYVVYKLLGDGPFLGAAMPLEGEPLAPDEIARVSDWIAEGAPDN